MKRALDLIISTVGLIVILPILAPFCLLIFLQDGYSPFYIAERVGLGGKTFKMVKLRSMIINAEKTGVDSTGELDNRITKIGHFVRKYKLDELTQLFNVFKGEMSLVGPRPNVKRETDLYTSQELFLLTAKPGITDFSSIIFSDEGAILKNEKNPDIAYHQLIRPWKSKYGIFYIHNKNLKLDIKLILITMQGIFSRTRALKNTQQLLKACGADQVLCELSLRNKKLIPSPPPGMNTIVTSR